MKTLILFLCFLLPSAFAQTKLPGGMIIGSGPAPIPIGSIITNNLLVDLDASKGLSFDSSGVYVTNWADQSGNNNFAFQENTNLAFRRWTNYLGYPCLRSYGSVLNVFTNFMTIGSGLSLNSQVVTVYVVATGPRERGHQSLFAFGGAYTNFEFLGFDEFNTYTDPLTMVAPQWNTTTTYPAQNLAVFVSENTTTNAVLRWNNTEETHAQSGSGTLNYGIIGGSGTSSHAMYGGDIVRILVYGTVGHTPAQRGSNVNALCSIHHIITNFNNQVICRGDSTTEGFLITNLLTWPWQCMESKPNVQWFNYGSGSARIQTNGSSGNVFYGSDGTFVDPVFNASISTNWLFVMGGVNDLNLDSQTGQNTYGRLTNYCAARLAAHPWKIVVATIPGDGNQPAQCTNYCNAIRNQSQAYWFGVADLGANSPVETRLNDFNNATYFADTPNAVHLTSTGYSVVKQWFLTFLP